MTQYLPQKFISSPVTVDAMRYSPKNCSLIHQWLDEPHLAADDEGYSLCGTGIIVHKKAIAQVGDWVCRDFEGFFVMNDAEFHQMFTPTKFGRRMRRWMVIAVVYRRFGGIVATREMSRHLLLGGARRAVAKYSRSTHPNPDLVLGYQILNINEIYEY